MTCWVEVGAQQRASPEAEEAQPDGSLEVEEAQHGASLERRAETRSSAHRIPEEELQELMRRCSLRADGKVKWKLIHLIGRVEAHSFPLPITCSLLPLPGLPLP